MARKTVRAPALLPAAAMAAASGGCVTAGGSLLPIRRDPAPLRKPVGERDARIALYRRRGGFAHGSLAFPAAAERDAPLLAALCESARPVDPCLP